MNPLGYPLIAVAMSSHFFRCRLVHSEEEHIRFLLEFRTWAILFYRVHTLETIYNVRQANRDLIPGSAIFEPVFHQHARY